MADIQAEKCVHSFTSHPTFPYYSPILNTALFLQCRKPAVDPSATNPRGIPVAPFVDNVADYVSSRADVEPTLRSFQEMISKYQFMELNTQRRGQGLKDKIPDIKKTLETVTLLRNRRKVCYSFALLSISF